MPTNFSFPSVADLNAIAQDKMPRLTQDRPIFQIMPMRNVNDVLVLWDQLDNFKGLQGARGLNGQPTRVQPLGFNRFQMKPGVYGDYIPLDEETLTMRAQMGTFGSPVNVNDLVMQSQDFLLQRMLDRIELTAWLSMGGTFTNYGPNGAVIHTDTFTVQTFTAAVPWATYGTATPLADLRSNKLKARGHSVNFGRKASLYINQKSVNDMLSNTNSSDLFGRRVNTGNTLNTLNDLNSIFVDNDLPQVVPYDEGYYDDAGAYQLFIPNNTGFLVGARPAGQALGEYRMTRNLNNDNGAPGMYMKVMNKSQDQVPPLYEVHVGHNGGPVIYYPTAIVKLTF